MSGVVTEYGESDGGGKSCREENGRLQKSGSRRVTKAASGRKTAWGCAVRQKQVRYAQSCGASIRGGAVKWRQVSPRRRSQASI